MSRDDKELLKMLAIMGALILASGTGLAVFMAHHGSKSPFADFMLGSAMAGVIITAACRVNS